MSSLGGYLATVENVLEALIFQPGKAIYLCGSANQLAWREAGPDELIFFIIILCELGF